MSALDKTARTDAAGDRRQITVVFVDIVGSSTLASRTDPEDMAEWLEAYYARTRAAVEQHGGIVTEYLGDGVIACFGLERSDELAASHAVTSALELVKPLAPPPGSHEPVALRAGIATSPVATRNQAARRGLPRVTGAVTIRACRIQEEGAPGEVLIAEETRPLLRGRFRTQPLGPRVLKGFGTASRVFRVLGPAEGPTLIEQSDWPFVGRSKELSRVQNAARPCLVVGEAGIGKSALAAEAARNGGVGCWIAGDGVHAASSHFPFRGWLAEILRPEAPSMAGLAAAFPGLGTDALLALAMVSGLPEGQRLLAEKSNLALEPMITTSLVRAMEQRTAPGSWIVIEDLHWFDNASFGVVRALLSDPESPSRRVLLTSREDAKLGTHLDGFDMCRVSLGPLGAADATAMLAALTGDPLDDAAQRTLLEAAGGVPLYIEQLHRHRAAAGLRLPPTLMDLLSERIDASGPVKPILQQAAILGRRFDMPLLAGMVGEAVDIEALLARAAELRIVERLNAQDWRFAHALLHRAAYQGILRRARTAYHARVAALLTDRFPERAAEEPALLAEHHARAGQHALAITRYLEAGQSAMLKGALADAERHVRLALDLCHGAPPNLDTIDLEIAGQTALGSVLMQSQGFTAPPVREAFETVRRLAATLGNPSHASAPALFGSFSHAIIVGDMDQSEVFCDLLTRMAREAGETAAEGDRSEVRLAALAAENCKAFYAGDFTEQFTRIAAIRETYDLNRHRAMILHYGMDIFAAAQMFEPVARAICGQGGQVRTLLAETDAHQQALNLPVMQPYALIWGAVPLFYIGARDDALARLRRGIAAANMQGSAFWQMIGEVWHAVMSLEAGPDGETLTTMRRQIDMLAESGTGIGMSYFEAVHARGLCRAGDRDRAWRQSAAAAEAGKASRLLCWQAEILRLHGLNCRDAGRTAEAEAAFAEALSLAEAQGAGLWALRVLLDMDRRSPAHDARLSALAGRIGASGPVPDLDRVDDVLGVS